MSQFVDYKNKKEMEIKLTKQQQKAKEEEKIRKIYYFTFSNFKRHKYIRYNYFVICNKNTLLILKNNQTNLNIVNFFYRVVHN